MKPAPIDDDEPGFFRRNIVMIILAVLALGGGGYLYANHKPSKATKSKKLDMVMVMPVVAPPPPPPPPPPPKKEEPPPEEDKKEEEMAPEEEPPPDTPAKVDKPAEEAIGTAIAGGDGSGLGLGTGSGIGGGTQGIGGKSYSARAVWQGKFSRTIQDLLARNQELKFAKGSVTFRMWLDESGRVTRVALNGTTGSPQMDDVLRSRALTGQVLEPAPPGTPMPVIMRFNGR